MSTPTSDIDETQPRISSKAELVARIESGCKPRSAWRIGAEHEKFPFLRESFSPVPYDGAASIRALLEGLSSRFGWKAILENGAIIGLSRGQASVSLEPGGQFELSGAPLEDAHQICAEIGNHLAECAVVAEPLGIGFLGLGFSPVWSLQETPVMPKGRYGIMTRYMGRVGRLGREMMFRSCTVQANLDYASEADMVRKMRASLALQPAVTALFANSPFAEGRTNGYQSYRAHVWTDTDPDRTGVPANAFDDGFGFEAYVDYALDTPMYFVRRGGRYIDCAGQSFRAFLAGALPALPGELPTLADFDDHLSTLFPEVRLKTFLEMRGADAGSRDRLCALSAFWAGVLYDEDALSEVLDLMKGWTAKHCEAARRLAPYFALSAPCGERTLGDIALAALDIARRGLARRARLNSSGQDETVFLEPLFDIAMRRESPAQSLLKSYVGEWGCRMEPVFQRCELTPPD